MQLTAGAVLGKFGKRARYWSERFLADGLVHIIASDAHTTSMRNPRLSEAVDKLEAAVGKMEAWRMVRERPQAILDNVEPHLIAAVPGLADKPMPAKARVWHKRFWSR